jgi:hypothetical protein
MSDVGERNRWIFVSHASADLRVVRKVRNYLEEKGGSPLLFHLRALTHADDFWPIIEKEIAARNFFLYCESESARKSEWVQRERRVIESLKPSPRVGSIRVDEGEPDSESLDRFLMSTHVFASYAHKDRDKVAPFLDVLDRYGYTLVTNNPSPLQAFSIDLDAAMAEVAQDGFVAVFLSADAVKSRWIEVEVLRAHRLGTRFVPVLLERVDSFPPTFQTSVLQYQWFDATVDPAAAPLRFIQMLNNRKW